MKLTLFFFATFRPCFHYVAHWFLDWSITIFFSIWVFFHEHSRFTGQKGKGQVISLSPLYYFHPLHRHLDISRAITADSSPLYIASSRTQTGNLLVSEHKSVQGFLCYQRRSRNRSYSRPNWNDFCFHLKIRDF